MLFAILSLAAVQSKCDASGAHPLYSVDEATLKQAWERGAELGKKKNGNPMSALGYLSKDIGTVRSPSWQKWSASWCVQLPPFARAMVAGFESGRRFETYESEGKAVVADMAGHKEDPERTIRFAVGLNAWPGINSYNDDINRRADERDVRATDFILLVDDRKVRLKDSTPGDSSTISGSINVPITDTSTVSTTSGGRRYSSTVSYTTTAVRGFDAYTAQYALVFPFFDADGKPYITKDSKRLMLRVIMPTGVRDVTIDIAKLDVKLK